MAGPSVGPLPRTSHLRTSGDRFSFQTLNPHGFKTKIVWTDWTGFVTIPLRGTVPDRHVPQTYAPADGGTFDYGEALVKLQGRETRVHVRPDPSRPFCQKPTVINSRALGKGGLRG